MAGQRGVVENWRHALISGWTGEASYLDASPDSFGPVIKTSFGPKNDEGPKNILLCPGAQVCMRDDGWAARCGGELEARTHNRVDWGGTLLRC